MLALIPARGGSKGLPGKNIKLLNGKPLIAYTIEAALNSPYISKVVVSTDDIDIYEIGLKYGAESTFLRPKKLAEDNSMAIDNYKYTLTRLKTEFGYDIEKFIVLQPTSPLRTVRDIDGAISLFNEKNADSVVSYCEEHHPISWHKYMKSNGGIEDIFDDGLKNRQEYKPSIFPNGAIYVFKYSLINSGRYYSDNSYAYIMSRKTSVDIDTIDDFEYAEFLMEKAR
ncbi:N-acylneuraminate cytidylyltransferase [Shewanella sp. UCD-FRSSP16_17]|uniref:acylneuraminate cytidylyltransferase family protein n=1 Tax=Shewanella sp. UCD-FRSSP16_17 TaxID=1853256 RepID=UPI0007EEEE9B|nr:acylneuraminate cytidylyltransferase family protein [Shewanella sp. UCD-FRSSP16_17]OBT09105.1 N-acylneuraminate cytidylyltransferase [Shewanella sp. UCD-FRSSP16_17]